MNTVILGADNPLGSELVTHLQSRELKCVSIAGSDPALESWRLLLNSFSVNQPAVVVNLQSSELLISVAEQDNKQALRILKNIARACRAHDAILIQLSDADVFAGRRTGDYREHDRPDARGDRVTRMIKAESYTRRRVRRHIVLRPGQIFSASGDNAFTRIIKSIERGDQLVCHADRFCPTPATDVARVIAAMIQQLLCGATPWGIYHYCCADACDMYQFAEAVVAQASQYWDLEREDARFKLGESRGEHLVLSCKQILSAFGIRQRKWRANLPSIVAEYFGSRL